MLNWKVVVPATSTFTGITFVLCVAYGVVAPAAFHSSWLLEAMLPGFKWLSITAFLLGLAETMIYGAGAALLYTGLYNAFARRADVSPSGLRAPRARAA